MGHWLLTKYILGAGNIGVHIYLGASLGTLPHPRKEGLQGSLVLNYSPQETPPRSDIFPLKHPLLLQEHRCLDPQGDGSPTCCLPMHCTPLSPLPYSRSSVLARLAMKHRIGTSSAMGTQQPQKDLVSEVTGTRQVVLDCTSTLHGTSGNDRVETCVSVKAQ